MFRSAVIRLTVWYLVIVMVMSAAFSFALYQALSSEVGLSLRHQAPTTLAPPHFGDRASFEQFRRGEIAAAQERVRQELLIFNLFVLLLGAGASYLLARRTLHPIRDVLEAQSRFTADASHELRTPLAAMKAEIEVALRQGKLSERESRALLGSNLEEIARLEVLSAGLLKLADFSNGVSESPKQPVAIKQVVAEARRQVQGLANQHKTSLTVQVGDDQVLGDQRSLTELFVILFDNAIKYSPPGKSVTVTARRDGRQLVIGVTDRGIGIKASDLPHLFERFYRADTSRSRRRVEGYGLGLSLAHKIAEAHRGGSRSIARLVEVRPLASGCPWLQQLKLPFSLSYYGNRRS